MKQEWKDYRAKVLTSFRYGVIAIGISFLFFLVNLPGTPKDQIKTTFLANMAISVFIAFLVSSMFALVRLFYTFQEIKTGVKREPSPMLGFIISFFGMTAGLFIGLTIRARVLNEKPDFSYLGTVLLSGAFISIAFILFGVYRKSRAELQELKTETVQAQYHALKNQMQPHFLFNSLNSVTELIESDKVNAAKMTQKLSDLYREILENSKQATVSLDSEISIVEKYLELERFRFGERLRFTIQVPKNTEQLFLPSLILQTLVENSIKHAISKAIEGGEVIINVTSQKDGLYRVTVKNSGGPFKKRSENGTGLKNTVTRLNLLYGSTHSFNIGSDEHGWVVASFNVSGARVG